MAIEPTIARQNRRGVWLFKWPLCRHISDFFSPATKTLPRWRRETPQQPDWTSCSGIPLHADDTHVEGVSCLGESLADAALSGGWLLSLRVQSCLSALADRLRLLWLKQDTILDTAHRRKVEGRLDDVIICKLDEYIYTPNKLLVMPKIFLIYSISLSLNPFQATSFWNIDVKIQHLKLKLAPKGLKARVLSA